MRRSVAALGAVALLALAAWGLAGCGADDAPAPEPPPEAEVVAEPAEPSTEPEPDPDPEPEPAAEPATPLGLAPAPAWAEPAQEGSRPSVLLLGIDGADWKVMDPLFDAGYLPNLARLVREGARADLDCAPAMPETACFCPPVWVSIATGVPQSQHGVSTIHHEAGARGAPAVWDVLHAAGGTTTLAAFRNTWPPEESARYVLTEYGLDWSANELYERLPPERPLLRMAMPHQRFKPETLLEDLGLVPFEGERTGAWKMVARDRVTMRALSRLVPKDRTDLTAVILHSPDKAEHLGWDSVQKTPGGPFDTDSLLAQARGWKGPVVAHDRFPGTNLASQYLEIDAWLGSLLADVAWDHIVVASDHGMARNPGPGLPGHHGVESPDGHQGVLVLWGEGVRPGVRLEDVDVFDVAPTLAWLLGLPVAEDLPGEVLVGAFEEGWRAQHPVATVASWESDQPKIEESTSTPTGQ